MTIRAAVTDVDECLMRLQLNWVRPTERESLGGHCFAVFILGVEALPVYRGHILPPGFPKGFCHAVVLRRLSAPLWRSCRVIKFCC